MQQCWERVVRQLNIVPDEGLCLDVLNTAARHGLPILASEALQKLETLGVQYREYHIAPLLDAFAAIGQLKEAFKCLELIRSCGGTPTRETVRPILRAIQRDPDSIDNAYMLLDEMVQDGEQVDVVSVNVIIEASAFLNDLQRAFGTYKAMPSLGVKPNTDTFNLLISTCVDALHRDLGDKLYTEMKEAKVKPDMETYVQLISLYLTQTEYEDAFFYLEEMKSQGLKPPLSVYEAIVRKCVSVGDARYRLAVEELNQMGYRLSSVVQKFIRTGGEASREGDFDLQIS